MVIHGVKHRNNNSHDGHAIRSAIMAKGRGKALDRSRNEELRKFLRQWIADNCDGNDTKAAERFGVSQPLVSGFLAGGKGAGPKLLEGIADATGRTVDELLGRTRRVAYEPGENRRYPVSALGNHPDWARLRSEFIASQRKTPNPHLLEQVAHAQFSNMPERLAVSTVQRAYDMAVDLYGEDYGGPSK
jgi:transcriptional regulator with XRE-family HTH domain